MSIRRAIGAWLRNLAPRSCCGRHSSTRSPSGSCHKRPISRDSEHWKPGRLPLVFAEIRQFATSNRWALPMRLAAAIPLIESEGCDHMVRRMPLLAAIPANRFASVSLLPGFGSAQTKPWLRAAVSRFLRVFDKSARRIPQPHWLRRARRWLNG